MIRIVFYRLRFTYNVSNSFCTYKKDISYDILHHSFTKMIFNPHSDSLSQTLSFSAMSTLGLLSKCPLL